MNAYNAGQDAAFKAFKRSEDKPDWKYFDAVRPTVLVNNKVISEEIQEVMEGEFIRGFNETLDQLKADYDKALAELEKDYPE